VEEKARQWMKHLIGVQVFILVAFRVESNGVTHGFIL